MDANSISLDVTQEDLSPLREKQPGETCNLNNVTVEVTANDGQTLSGRITAAELSDEYSDEAQAAPAEAAKPAAKSTKPIAIIAVGAKQKA